MIRRRTSLTSIGGFNTHQLPQYRHVRSFPSPSAEPVSQKDSKFKIIYDGSKNPANTTLESELWNDEILGKWESIELDEPISPPFLSKLKNNIELYQKAVGHQDYNQERGEWMRDVLRYISERDASGLMDLDLKTQFENLCEQYNTIDVTVSADL